MTHMNRRDLLTGAAALGLAGLLPFRAHAAGNLTAAIYPGTWEDAYRGVLAPALKKSADIDVAFDPLFAVDQVAKVRAARGDPGSPYAIGSPEGGHDAIHPELGTLDDFRALMAACRAHGMEIALDFAVQCSPDHPWLVEHPDWFRRRPDGSIHFAENPPKKYEDIVNPDFRGAHADAGVMHSRAA